MIQLVVPLLWFPHQIILLTLNGFNITFYDFSRCSVFGDNARAFRTSGAVSKIVKYLYIEDTSLQEATVRALYQLSRDPANCAIIHEYGGVKVRDETTNV